MALEESLPWICTSDTAAHYRHNGNDIEQRRLQKLLEGTFVAISGSGPFIASLEDEHPILASLLLLTHPGEALLQGREGRELRYSGDKGTQLKQGQQCSKHFDASMVCVVIQGLAKVQ